jgi:hypothetical protein
MCDGLKKSIATREPGQLRTGRIFGTRPYSVHVRPDAENHGSSNRTSSRRRIIVVFSWGTAFDGILGMILAIPLTAFFVTAWRLARFEYIRVPRSIEHLP